MERAEDGMNENFHNLDVLMQQFIVDPLMFDQNLQYLS